MPSKNIVIGTIGADAHMIGAWVLQKALTTAGFNVTFLGAVVPQEEFISAAIETLGWQPRSYAEGITQVAADDWWK